MAKRWLSLGKREKRIELKLKLIYNTNEKSMVLPSVLVLHIRFVLHLSDRFVDISRDNFVWCVTTAQKFAKFGLEPTICESVNKRIHCSAQKKEKRDENCCSSRTGFWRETLPKDECPHWYPATQKSSGHVQQDSSSVYLLQWTPSSTISPVTERWGCVQLMLMGSG